MARKTKSARFTLNNREYLSLNHPDLPGRLADYSINYITNLSAQKDERIDSHVVGSRRYICPETTILMLKLGLNRDGAFKLYQGGLLNAYCFREDLLEKVRDILKGPHSFSVVNPKKSPAEIIPFDHDTADEDFDLDKLNEEADLEDLSDLL